MDSVSTIVDKDCRGTYPKGASLSSRVSERPRDLYFLLRDFVKSMFFQHLQELSESIVDKKWANSGCVGHFRIGLQPTLWDSLQGMSFTVAYHASFNPNSAGFGGFQSSGTDKKHSEECTFTEAVGVSTCPLAFILRGSRTIPNRNLFQIALILC